MRERGLKFDAWFNLNCVRPSRSREGAWIEILKKQTGKNACMCRSREGAWIEIVAVDKSKVGFCVAPVRERGLKSDHGKSAVHPRASLP